MDTPEENAGLAETRHLMREAAAGVMEVALQHLRLDDRQAVLGRVFNRTVLPSIERKVLGDPLSDGAPQTLPVGEPLYRVKTTRTEVRDFPDVPAIQHFIAALLDSGVPKETIHEIANGLDADYTFNGRGLTHVRYEFLLKPGPHRRKRP